MILIYLIIGLLIECNRVCSVIGQSIILKKN